MCFQCIAPSGSPVYYRSMPEGPIPSQTSAFRLPPPFWNHGPIYASSPCLKGCPTAGASFFHIISLVISGYRLFPSLVSKIILWFDSHCFPFLGRTSFGNYASASMWLYFTFLRDVIKHYYGPNHISRITTTVDILWNPEEKLKLIWCSHAIFL